MNNIFKKLGNNSNWVIFSLFALSIFIKCVFFHYACFNYVAVRSLWHAPIEFLAFYFAKLLPALFFASFVFLFKRQWWTIVASVVIDLWLIANEIYFKINYLFLDYETISIASNLNGFGNSILPFLSWSLFCYSFITLLYVIIYKHLFPQNERNISLQLIVIAVCGVFVLFDCLWGYGGQKKFIESPWQTAVRVGNGTTARTLNGAQFGEKGSGLHYILCNPIYQISRFYYEKKHGSTLTEAEKMKIQGFIGHDILKYETNGLNIVTIIIESFESWIMSISDTLGQEVTPNINNFSNSDNCCHFTKIESEARGGSSGDGQMIINTGLLPISSGAACMLFGKNIYPNYAHFFPNTYLFDPCCGNVWNQLQMTKSYGYKQNIPKGGSGGGDDWISNLFLSVIDTIKQPFCCQTITISTHTPFNSVKTKNLRFPEEMPTTVQNYLQSFHFTDSCIGEMLNGLKSRSLLDNTIVVITGDHTIFKKSMLGEFQSFAQKYSNYTIPSAESYCPLIIYSTKIRERTVVDELCYQMDIFPTSLHCIGADDYYWKGFGVNLLDSAARHNRKITEDEAYILSDKMIRSDYFRGIGE